MASWWQFEVNAGWARLVVGRRPALTLVRAAVVAVVLLVLFKGILLPIRVTGPSMEPTYRNGHIGLLSRVAYWRAAPQRGDVVGIRKEDSRMTVLKRIVGLPGERVAVRGGRVYVNGRIPKEPYAEGRGIPSTRGEVVLGADEYFAIGDNRDVTAYDRVLRREIIGRLWF